MITRRQFALAPALQAATWAPLAANAASTAANVLATRTAPVLAVGPRRPVKTLRDAARLAPPGSVIEVDAGDYPGDVAVWTQDDVTLRAVGGRVRLPADGRAAEGKGIWVVRARRMRVVGFDFENARVRDRNGAGIRLDKGSLLVRDCRFLHNEMGLLTNNDPNTELQVENCEFGFNHRPDGHNHNLYAGRIARLSVTGSYFHHARTGHLLKSRAEVNFIRYNRLTDEAGGSASYELEFPDGGLAVVVGNIVAQSPDTDNRHLISFGAESYAWPRNSLYLAHNTLVDPLPWGGVFLRVADGASAVAMVNNLLVGRASLHARAGFTDRNNLRAEPEDFVDMHRHDYRLRENSHLVGMAEDPGPINGMVLRPTHEYHHPCATQRLGQLTHNPGATQSVAPALPIR